MWISCKPYANFIKIIPEFHVTFMWISRNFFVNLKSIIFSLHKVNKISWIHSFTFTCSGKDTHFEKMRSYDGESSSCEEDDRRESLPEAQLQQGAWQRSTSHPNWGWDQRTPVRFLQNLHNYKRLKQCNFFNSTKHIFSKISKDWNV